MNNFNKDWNSGKALGALVDSIAPGLFPDWEDLKAEDKVENARKAMKLAEDWLGVPQVCKKKERNLIEKVLIKSTLVLDFMSILSFI